MFGEEVTIGAFIDFLNKKVCNDTGMDIVFKSKEIDEDMDVEAKLQAEGIDWTVDAQEIKDEIDYQGNEPICISDESAG